jgi:hypothetical protein
MAVRRQLLEWPEEPVEDNVESTPCDDHSRPALGSSTSRPSALDLSGTRAERFRLLKEQLGNARQVGGRLERERDARDAAAPPFPTALEALDRLLDGGLVRGQLVELVGRRSSGRFSALLAALAATTQAGDAAAFVDLGDGLSPLDATHAGVCLERLLWLRPTRVGEALASAEMLLQGGFPLVVVDLGSPPLPGGRGNEAGWLRLARGARDRGAALLVSAPYRVSGTAAAVVVAADGERGRWLGPGGPFPLLAGLESAIAVEKDRRGGLGRSRERLLLATADALEQQTAPAASPSGMAPPSATAFRLAAAGGAR